MQAELRLPCGTVEVIDGSGSDRKDAERAVGEAGIRLPLPHRQAWAAAHTGDRSRLLLVRDHDRRVLTAVGVQITQSRALPSHVLIRTERFGTSLALDALSPALSALAVLGRTMPRVLRIHAEVYAPSEAVRSTIATAAQQLGFVKAVAPRSYERTLLIDLEPDEDELFGSLHATARRHVRAVAKNPTEVRTIGDADLAGRLDELLRETLSRTAGEPQSHDWPAVIRMSAAAPASSRLVGLFRTDATGPESLLAFAWGCAHGDHAHYSTAASTRKTELRIPMAYPLAWDLISWAKRSGCRTFDFGGISSGSHGSADPLGGISDFKRYFSTNEALVGDEWILEPNPVSAKLAGAVSSLHRWVLAKRA